MSSITSTGLLYANKLNINESYPQSLTLSREDGQKYQLLLGTENHLFHEISRILTTYQSGIHCLSSGQKINATRFQLLGGATENVIGAIRVNVSSKSDLKSHTYEAPEGKYIKSYKINYIGKQEDIDRIDSALYSFGCNSKISEEDKKHWEKGGELGIKEGFTQLDATAHGSFKSTSEKSHKRESSNQMVVLDLKAKNGGFFKEKGHVEVIVDVELDDIPAERNILAKEVIAKISESVSKEGSIEAVVGNQATLKELVDAITKLEAIIHKCEAKGDIKAESNIPKVLTEDQMKESVAIDELRSEIDRISKEVTELKKDKENFFENWRKSKNNKEDEDILNELKTTYDKAKEDILAKEARKKALENQIDNINSKRSEQIGKK